MEWAADGKAPGSCGSGRASCGLDEPRLEFTLPQSADQTASDYEHHHRNDLLDGYKFDLVEEEPSERRAGECGNYGSQQKGQME